MSRPACLIICHDISATLLYLVEMLDDERNDIYIWMQNTQNPIKRNCESM